jgi:hypothetical protein
MGYEHPIYQANGYYAFSSRREGLLSGPPSFKSLLEMCAGIRRAGCCSLLMDADAELFHQCLSVSANAYAYFLQQISSDEQVVSRGTPFFDALACNDFRAAREIAERSTASFKRDLEYEEDALYFRFLFELLFLEDPTESGTTLLAEYARVIEEQPDPRLEMGYALLERERTRFASAIEGLIERHEASIAELAERYGLPDERLSTEGKVFIEGLAMLRVAERLDIPTERHYPLIPSLARGDYSATFQPDAWRTF